MAIACVEPRRVKSLLGVSLWLTAAARPADFAADPRECVLNLSKGVLADFDISLFGKLELSGEHCLEDEVGVGVLNKDCLVDFLTLGWDVLFLKARHEKVKRQTKSELVSSQTWLGWLGCFQCALLSPTSKIILSYSYCYKILTLSSLFCATNMRSGISYKGDTTNIKMHDKNRDIHTNTVKSYMGANLTFPENLSPHWGVLIGRQSSCCPPPSSLAC